MTQESKAILRSFLAATSTLLEWEGLGSLKSEDELRAAFTGAFLHSREASLGMVPRIEINPPAGFEKRLDLQFAPAWPPSAKPLVVGELKFFQENQRKSYLVFIGRRLSDLHLVHYLAHKSHLFTFFLDVIQDPDLVSRKGNAAVKNMCQKATAFLNAGGKESDLAAQPGIKTFAEACVDKTERKATRKVGYGFLFPPMDLKGSRKRGPAFIRTPQENPDGLISIGVRMSGKEDNIPYRFVPKSNGSLAFAMALFSPSGKLVLSTSRVIEEMESLNLLCSTNASC